MSQTLTNPHSPLHPDHGNHPNHHLWKNGNVWWVAYTVHLPGWKKTRFRQSLGTTDVEEARRRRDVLFFLWGKSGDAKLSLRFQPPRTAREDAA